MFKFIATATLGAIANAMDAQALIDIENFEAALEGTGAGKKCRIQF